MRRAVNIRKKTLRHEKMPRQAGAKAYILRG